MPISFQADLGRTLIRRLTFGAPNAIYSAMHTPILVAAPVVHVHVTFSTSHFSTRSTLYCQHMRRGQLLILTLYLEEEGPHLLLEKKKGEKPSSEILVSRPV